ncbi:GNAT family N-acetyltransferase [Fuscibacter oryzae]|uniref:L-ornithine N(alpha)-acyltransferase n=1 Tax=Fuscibacter oryzae TaxID=2803939 RepID=A0A8J7MRX3_9RHOB|nr:GNAT family N-acyltransferase [Fuscibacter oryzae]MBL4927629.1 GNAT family N-acetyltransferase [Fuscibacter oryzae]
MQVLEKGRLRARLAEGPEDVARAQALRHLCFRKGGGLDADGFDPRCRHVLIEERDGDHLLSCFRLLEIPTRAALTTSYAAQFYDLGTLSGLSVPAIEIGRFCIAPGQTDPDILRLAWVALTRIVDDEGFAAMFGCTSFPSADPDRHSLALAALRPHVAMPGQGPQRRAPETLALCDLPPPQDPRAALAGLPAILRTYLGMGGWVSDHAVIDRDLDTLHVFTAVEVARVPAARARALRALAG